MKITFEQFKQVVGVLESEALCELVAKKLNESASRICITNTELSDNNAVIINVAISYCSCCSPEGSSVYIYEEEFNELLGGNDEQSDKRD